jgi:hypothetical protein
MTLSVSVLGSEGCSPVVPLRATIHDHLPITLDAIGSATKRVRRKPGAKARQAPIGA